MCLIKLNYVFEVLSVTNNVIFLNKFMSLREEGRRLSRCLAWTLVALEVIDNERV